MAVWLDLKGTSETKFRLGKTGSLLKQQGSAIAFRDKTDVSYVDISCEFVNINGNEIYFNSFASDVGDDRTMVLLRPTTGMLAYTEYTLPPNPIDGYFLKVDASGVMSWDAVVSAPTNTIMTDSTSFDFSSVSPIPMFSLPANAVVHSVDVIVDTAFDGVSPQIRVGPNATPAKYMDYLDSDLQALAESRFTATPNKIPLGVSEALEASFSFGGATVGAGRIIVSYSIPA